MRRPLALTALCSVLLLVACTDDADVTSSATVTATATAELTPTSTASAIGSPTPEVTSTSPAGPRRTGDASLDAIIAAVERRDVEALDGLVEYVEIECLAEPEMSWHPRCEEGEREGTVVPGFPRGACEGSLVRNATEEVVRFAQGTDGFWAALDTPDDYRAGRPWVSGDTLLVFHNVAVLSHGAEDHAVFLEVREGRIIGTGAACVGPLDELLEAERGLTVTAGPWHEAEPEPDGSSPATGIAPVDDVLRDVWTGDHAALVARAARGMEQLPRISCRDEDLNWLDWPDCRIAANQDEDALVVAFPIVDECIASFVRDPREIVSTFMSRAPSLLSVHEGPQPIGDVRLDPAFFAGAYWLVFESPPGPGEFTRPGSRLAVSEDGAIVGVQIACRGIPAELGRWDGAPLPEIEVREP